MNRLFFIILLGLIIPLVSLADSTHSANFVAASSQYLTHADGGVYSIQDGWTVEAWIRSFNNTADDQIIFQKRVDGADNIGLTIAGVSTNQLVGRVDNNDLLTNNVITGDNNWRHVAVFFNGASGKLYVDGVLATTTGAMVAAATTTSAVFQIGARGAVIAVYFNGAIDDFRIWNDERTATEINDNKGCELVGNEQGLTAYYKFNGATIDLTDSTSGGNTLTNNNGVTASTSVPSIIGTCGAAAAPPPSIESDFIIFSLLWLRDDRIYLCCEGRRILI